MVAGSAQSADLVVLDVDATIVIAHSEKEQAARTFKKTFGYQDGIRHAKDIGLGRFPSREYGINTAWLLAVGIAADLTAWLRLLALPETLKTCEPKALRYRFLHIPARLTRSGRRRHLRLPQSWPWTTAAVAVFTAVMAIPLLT